MPIKKSAIKELRKSKKIAIANKRVKDGVKKLIKNSRKEIEVSASSSSSEDNKKNAIDLIKRACKALDKAAQKKIIKKNNAGRRKSRLMKKLNALNKK